MITKQQLSTTENWIYKNARPLEIAKWNLLWGKGNKEELVAEMVKYQNADGGFGNGFEADILTPESAAIPSCEAIFMAQDYNLDLTADWAKKLYYWLENTVQSTPSFWNPVPKSLEDYPHAPWWSYSEDIIFTPNPCAVAASALILYGTESQKALGQKAANKCIDYLLTNDDYWDHDTYCLQRLFMSLQKQGSPLINEQAVQAMNTRILKTACLDQSKYMEYVSQPIDLVDSPKSPWYDILKDSIPSNLNYLLDTLNNDEYWNPNFSWGVDTDISRQVTQNWIGYIAVKRVKILGAFGMIE